MQKNRPLDHPTSDLLDRDASRMHALLVDLGRMASLRDPIAGVLEQAELTPSQVHAVMWLGHDGALTMGELSRRNGISEKTMTGVVDRLEAAGHVQRERDPDDRRIVRVRLTEQGAGVYQSCERHLLRRLRGFLALLDPSDRNSLCNILQTVNERLGQKSAESGEAS